MVCVFCGKPTKVVNSRQLVRSNQVWRRRHCLSCQNTFTSFETASEGTVLMVKGTGLADLQPFSRDKLFISLYESCKHRSKAVKEAGALTDTVIHKALKLAQHAVIDQAQLQAIATQTLKRFDRAAAVHYQAYYFKT